MKKQTSIIVSIFIKFSIKKIVLMNWRIQEIHDLIKNNNKLCLKKSYLSKSSQC